MTSWMASPSSEGAGQSSLLVIARRILRANRNAPANAAPTSTSGRSVADAPAAAATAAAPGAAAAAGRAARWWSPRPARSPSGRGRERRGVAAPCAAVSCARRPASCACSRLARPPRPPSRPSRAPCAPCATASRSPPRPPRAPPRRGARRPPRASPRTSATRASASSRVAWAAASRGRGGAPAASLRGRCPRARLRVGHSGGSSPNARSQITCASLRGGDRGQRAQPGQQAGPHEALDHLVVGHGRGSQADDSDVCASSPSQIVPTTKSLGALVVGVALVQQAEDPARQHLLDRAVERHRGELRRHRVAELAVALRLAHDVSDQPVGLADLGAGACARTSSPRA